MDCGLSGRETFKRMAAAGLDHRRLKALLVSHEHRDHILGVGVMARKLNLPIYINEATLDRALPVIGKIRPNIIKTGCELDIGPIRIHPFSISHDAADPVGFTFENNGVKLGLATDLGVATKLVVNRLAGCRALIVESNHDPKMLIEGPYPWETKRRVQSRRGHLSNQESAELIQELTHEGLENVVLAHLSQTNNRPELALEAVCQLVLEKGKNINISAAKQDEPGHVITLPGS